MTPKEYATTSGIIFLLVALAHLMRVIAGWDFRVAGWDISSWVSVIAVVVAGYLSYAGLRIAIRFGGITKEATMGNSNTDEKSEQARHESMDYGTALSRYQSQVGAMDQLWAMLILICVAAIASLSNPAIRVYPSRIGIVLFIFAVFAFGNIYSAYRSQELLYQLHKTVNAVAGNFPHVHARTPLSVCIFHGAISIGVVGILVGFLLHPEKGS